MSFDFKLPDLGEGMTEAEIRKWLVREGDIVSEHQNIVEVETDKAVIEVPSPKSGMVSKIYKSEGEIAKVGETIMTIEEGVERKSTSVVGEVPEEEAAPLATPRVRRLAKELGIDISTLRGSGPGGSITIEDVEAASSKRGALSDEFGPVEYIEFKGLRRTIARNLSTSQKTTVFVTGMDEADVTELWQLREREKKGFLEKGLHLTFLPFFIKAVQHAIKEHPLLNSSLDEEAARIIIKKYLNIGIAVDTPEGLMVPVIKDVEKKTILDLALEIESLASRARERKIKLEELRGNTFTITNYGHFGGTFATPIINYPDSAILGTGKIVEKPWVRNGKIEIRKILHLSLTFDHRVTDGADAAKFLTKVIKYLEDPALLFIESA